MKFLLITIFVSLIHFSFGQLEFYIDNQVVDQNVVQTVDSQGQSYIDAQFDFKNVSSDTLLLVVERCVLQDSPNWVLSFLTAHPDGPFGGVLIPATLITEPCWQFPLSNLGMVLLPPGGEGVYRDAYEISGDGCELVEYTFSIDSGQTLVDAIQIDYCTTLGINEVSQSTINVYPNPVSEELIVTSDDSNIESIVLLDMNGRIIFSQKVGLSSELNIDCRTLDEGVYMANIKLYNQVVLRRKVTIVH